MPLCPESQNRLNGRSDIITSASMVILAMLANLIDCLSTWLDVMSQGKFYTDKYILYHKS